MAPWGHGQRYRVLRSSDRKDEKDDPEDHHLSYFYQSSVIYNQLDRSCRCYGKSRDLFKTTLVVGWRRKNKFQDESLRNRGGDELGGVSSD